jgi:hypothetical protein
LGGLLLTYARGTVAPVSNRDVSVHNAGELMPLLDVGERAGALRSARGPFTMTPELHVVVKRGPSDEEPNEQIYWAMGRVDKLPTWPEPPGDDLTGDSPAADQPHELSAAPEAQVRRDAAFEAAVESASSELLAEVEGQPTAAEPWYVLMQFAFLGAAVEDRALTLAAARLLETRGNRRRTAAAKLAAAYLAGLADAPVPSEALPGTTLPEIIPYAAAAFVHERMDLVRAALAAFRPTTAGQPRRIAFLRCLQMLTGEKRSVYKPN